MSAKARWIRLSVDFDDSEWVDALSDAAQLAWIKLMCHVKREGDGRHKIVSPKVAARKWRITDHNAVMEMLDAAVLDGAIRIEDGFWVLSNWDEYQKPDRTNTDRQKRHRQKLNLDNAVISPKTAHNGVTSSRDIDRDIEIQDSKETTSVEKLPARPAEKSAEPAVEKPEPEKPKKVDPNVAIIKRAESVLAYLRDVSGRKIATDASNGNCKHLRALIRETHVADRDGLMSSMRLVVDYKCAEWGAIPDKRVYLRPETLFAPEHWHSYLTDATEWDDAGRPPPRHAGNGKADKPSIKDIANQAMRELQAEYAARQN